MDRLITGRLLAGLAAASLLVASLIHSGVLIDGYNHDGAALPEAIIGGVVLVGLGLSWAPEPWGWRSLVCGLGFGLAGSLVGLFLVVVGVGPQTVPDLVYHLLLVGTLAGGLIITMRSQPEIRAGSVS